MKANSELRNEILRNRLKHWEVAEKLGISSSYFSVLLRTEMTEQWQERTRKAIAELIRGVR